MRRIILFLAAFVLFAMGTLTGAELRRHNDACREKAEYYDLAAKREKNWIMENQTPEGAFVTYRIKTGKNGKPEENGVNPYFANVAALALIAGEPGSGELESVRRYLDWYLDHLNRGDEDRVNGEGTIYDYSIFLSDEGEEAVSKGEYDSVDSYCGTFLMLAADYVETAGDFEWAVRRENELFLVMDALLSCMDGEGMAMAKKEHPVRYLMDNSEVNAGLRGAEYLLGNVLEPGERLRRVTDQLEKNTRKIKTAFWNEGEKRYETGFDRHGEPLSFRGFDHLYAEASAQVFPLVFGVEDADSGRTAAVYEKLCGHFDWQRMDYVEEGESKFYWTVFGYAGALMGDLERTEEFFLTYEEKTGEDRGYPLHIDDAGWMARAAAEMKRRYEEKMIGGGFI